MLMAIVSSSFSACQKSSAPQASGLEATKTDDAKFVYSYSCAFMHVSADGQDVRKNKLVFDGTKVTTFGSSVELDGYKANLNANHVVVNGFNTAQLKATIEKSGTAVNVHTEYSSIPAKIVQVLKTESDVSFFLDCDRTSANKQLIMNSNR
jgi:hypothetical protein